MRRISQKYVHRISVREMPLYLIMYMPCVIHVAAIYYVRILFMIMHKPACMWELTQRKVAGICFMCVRMQARFLIFIVHLQVAPKRDSMYPEQHTAAPFPVNTSFSQSDCGVNFLLTADKKIGCS